MTEKIISGLQDALFYAGGTHTLADVLDDLSDGRAQLHMAEGENATIITQIIEEPQMRVCHFWLATGDLDTVVELSKEVLLWAKEMGCERATMAGRRGWERVLATEGWQPMLTLMGREV